MDKTSFVSMRKTLVNALRIAAIFVAPEAFSAPVSPLQIVSEPADVLVPRQGSVTLAVKVTGSPAPTYQWALNGDPIPGATQSSFSLTHMVPADGGSYSCFIQNAYQTLQTDPASVVVDVPVLPFSDNLGDRGSLPSNSGTGRANNELATLEFGEPWIFWGVNHTVWISWTAPQDGVAQFDTIGSDFDTILGVFVPARSPGVHERIVPIGGR
jgi:hypothetical protein